MVHSDFTLKKVKQDFSLMLVEQPSFLPDIKPIAPIVVVEAKREDLNAGLG